VAGIVVIPLPFFSGQPPPDAGRELPQAPSGEREAFAEFVVVLAHRFAFGQELVRIRVGRWHQRLPSFANNRNVLLHRISSIVEPLQAVQLIPSTRSTKKSKGHVTPMTRPGKSTLKNAWA
jgi:hypothetical protein